MNDATDKQAQMPNAAPDAAQAWENRFAPDLAAIKAALAEKDRYLADEILERIAPTPKDGEVREAETIGENAIGHEIRVLSPQTGKPSNADGPAVVKADGTRKWYWSGMLHNPRGPAILHPNGDIEYYYLGTKCKSAAELDATVERANRFARTSKNFRNATPSEPADA